VLEGRGADELACFRVELRFPADAIAIRNPKKNFIVGSGSSRAGVQFELGASLTFQGCLMSRARRCSCRKLMEAMSPIAASPATCWRRGTKTARLVPGR